MKDLRTFYIRSIIGAAVGLVIAASIYENQVIPWIELNYPNYIIIGSALNSRVVFLVLMTSIHFLVNNWLWKVVKPSYNYNGTWEGRTYYDEVIESPNQNFEKFSSGHNMKIKQTCLSIELSPTSSKEYVNWGSKSVNLSNDDTLDYSYWVNYESKIDFPKYAIGVEELKVSNRLNNKRPNSLAGVFYHCIKGSGPFYRGEVKFNHQYD